MKNVKDYLLYAMCIVAIAFSAGSFVKVYASQGNNSVASTSGVNAQPVDLTYATDKALPSVVTVRVVTNSKTQVVEMEDPFGDFFDPFGFFGRGQGGTQRRQVQTPKRQGSGSGVIISAGVMKSPSFSRSSSSTTMTNFPCRKSSMASSILLN